MVAGPCVPRPSSSRRLQKFAAPASLPTDEDQRSNLQVTELLSQLMRVQQESLNTLLKWSESKYSHGGRSMALDTVALSGYVEEMKSIISRSHAVITALDDSFAKLDCIASSVGIHGRGDPPMRYPPPSPSVHPEQSSPPQPPPPPPTVSSHFPYPAPHGPPAATSNQPPATSTAQLHSSWATTSGIWSSPHPPTHPPDYCQGQPQDRRNAYTIDDRPWTEKRRRTLEAGESVTQAREAEIQAFLEGLPQDMLSAEEEDMRAALVEAWKVCMQKLRTKLRMQTAGKGSFLPEKAAAEMRGAGVRLSIMCTEKIIVKAKSELLPPTVPLQRWMEGRIGDEFQITRLSGQVMVTWNEPEEERALRLQEKSDERDTERDDFFDTLPKDELTAEENDLHCALLEAWKKWTKRYEVDKVRLSLICGDDNVRKAKSALLPAAVTVRRWIEARIGEELTLSEDAGGELMATLISEEF